jgi:hypothetical protein
LTRNQCQLRNHHRICLRILIDRSFKNRMEEI